MGRGSTLLLALALLGMLSAVGCAADTSPPRAGETPTTSSENREASWTNEASEVVRRHIAAINRGDVDAYLAEVGPDATFDIGGRTFEGRRKIRSFAEGEVAGGRYKIIDERIVEDGVAFDLHFRRGELYEQLTYHYTVEGGMIRNLVATYR